MPHVDISFQPPLKLSRDTIYACPLLLPVIYPSLAANSIRIYTHRRAPGLHGFPLPPSKHGGGGGGTTTTTQVIKICQDSQPNQASARILHLFWTMRRRFALALSGSALLLLPTVRGSGMLSPKSPKVHGHFRGVNQGMRNRKSYSMSLICMVPAMS